MPRPKRKTNTYHKNKKEKEVLSVSIRFKNINSYKTNKLILIMNFYMPEESKKQINYFEVAKKIVKNLFPKYPKEPHYIDPITGDNFNLKFSKKGEPKDITMKISRNLDIKSDKKVSPKTNLISQLCDTQVTLRKIKDSNRVSLTIDLKTLIEATHPKILESIYSGEYEKGYNVT